MDTCGQAGCTGHLGKFSDCLTIAVWQESLEFSDNTTGGTDNWGLHLALMVYDEDTQVDIDDGPTIIVPAGGYIVVTGSSGKVNLWAYPFASDAREEFESQKQQYDKWVYDNDPEI